LELQARQRSGRGILAQPLFLTSAMECGDANFDRTLTAIVALLTLHVAVGNRYCALPVCALNGDAEISASDASRTLRASVGNETEPLRQPSGTTVPPPFQNPWFVEGESRLAPRPHGAATRV